MTDQTTTTDTVDTADPEVLREQIADLKQEVGLAKAQANHYNDRAEEYRSLITNVLAPIASDNPSEWIDDLREWANGDEGRASIVYDLVGVSLATMWYVSVSVPVNVYFEVEAFSEDEAREQAESMAGDIYVTHNDATDYDVDGYNAEVTHCEEA